MANVTFPPLTGGIDNISPSDQIPPGFFLDAVDVLANRVGDIATRPGKRRLFTAAAMHSLWHSAELNVSLCVSGRYLCRVGIHQNNLYIDPLIEIVGNSRMSYAEADGRAWCSNGYGLWSIDLFESSLIAQPATLPVLEFDAEAAGSGGLDEGVYAVAVSAIDEGHEEGALSAMKFVNVAPGCGVKVTVVWPDPCERPVHALIHLTAPNGESLRRVVVLMPSAGNPGYDDVTVGATDRLGRIADTRYLQPMPPGEIVRFWRGRLLTADGPVLRWSEPMRYGLNHELNGFLLAGSDITMVEPVEGGVFLGTSEEVVFLSGGTPEQWTRTRTAAAIPFPGCSLTVPAHEFGGDMGAGAQRLALWLSAKGLVIGRPDGSIQEVQADRLTLLQAQYGGLAVHQRRLWASVRGGPTEEPPKTIPCIEDEDDSEFF
jgi:hypothetical protein